MIRETYEYCSKCKGYGSTDHHTACSTCGGDGIVVVQEGIPNGRIEIHLHERKSYGI